MHFDTDDDDDDDVEVGHRSKGVGPALGDPLDPRKVTIRLSAVRASTRRSTGKREVAIRPTFVPKNLWNKWRFEPAMPTYPMSKQVRLDTSLAGLENSMRNTSFVRTKFREKNDDAGRNFALIGGRCGGGYEQKPQQSTT